MKSAMAERIERETRSYPVVVYMNGTAAFPLCPFSATVVNVFSKMGIPFKDVNIADDGELRQALRDYADWPIFPVVFIKGAFIGGADIIQEMLETGEWQDYFG
jgi:monothiol glutaredoxin